MCQFSVAVNRQTKDDAGNTREEVVFFDVESWGKQAETIAKYFARGRPILFDGRLRMDTWEDKASGQKRSRLKLVLESFTFMGSRAEGGAAPAGDSASAVPVPATDGIPQDDVPY